MLEPYTFPSEDELFIHKPYTSRFEANAEFRRSLATNIAWFAQGALVFTVSFVLIFGAAYWGLSRAEQAYQEASRV